MINLRPYQLETRDAIWRAWAERQRPAIVLPTGSGKTVVFAALVVEIRRNLPESGQIVILVHRDELVQQTVKALHDAAPDLKVGIVKAKDNDRDAPIIVASVQTLARPARLNQITNVGWVIVDECHLAGAASYRRILEHFGCFKRTARIDSDKFTWSYDAILVGFTATLKRIGGGLGDIFTTVAKRIDILDLINDGWLVNPRGKQLAVNGLSLADAKVSGSDFTGSSLSAILTTDSAIETALGGWITHASGRQTMVFTPSIAATDMYTAAFGEVTTAAGVTSEMPADERRSVLQAYREGDIRVLVNCMVFTTGTDLPMTDCILIARPTLYEVLYAQMVGRGLRLWIGKTDCLVLDLVGATGAFRLRTLADLTDRRLITGVQDGESLLAAVEREQERGNPDLAGYRLSITDVDLFHRSHLNWLRTNAGLWFIKTRGFVYFLWPVQDEYMVARIPSSGNTVAERMLEDPVPFETAIDWTETFVDRDENREQFRIASRDSHWYRRRSRPTEPQIQNAIGTGLTEKEARGMSKGELSDAITRVKVSRMIDAWVT